MMLEFATCMWKNDNQIVNNIETDSIDWHARQKDSCKGTDKNWYRKTSDSQDTLKVFGPGMCRPLLPPPPQLLLPCDFLPSWTSGHIYSQILLG